MLVTTCPILPANSVRNHTQLTTTHNEEPLIPEPRAHILVVDDSAITRQTFSMLLSSRGYRVTTAEDGYDALGKLLQELPDLIISDLNMPRLNGYDLLPLVRQRHPHIPIVVATGDANAPLALADAVYVKGKDQPQDLIRTVATLMKSDPLSLSNG
jgi:CheY-like chemotaxis protein